MKNRIILGSANFDQTYGIRKNFIRKSEIKRLLNLASKSKVKVIDTSPHYHNSEKIIGSLNKGRFKIISKIPKIPKNIEKKNIKKWIKSKASISLKNLKIKKFECLLLQNVNSLQSKHGSEIYKSMKSVKTNGLTNKIGISIYDFNSLGKILKKFKFDLIQAPLNIFDQRLIETGWLKKLKEKKIEVHVRSIFLQGILFLKHNQLPRTLKKFKKNWKIWENWLKKNKLKPLQACLLFIFKQNELDGVVLGCNNRNQLNKILKLNRTKSSLFMSNLNIKNRKLIDPRKWIN